MILKSITISCFKNISELNTGFSPKLNCITGSNGSGKTNLLDAVYYLAMTKSYFPGPDLNTISYDSPFCRVAGEFLREDRSFENISFTLEREGKKQIQRNLKPYTRFSDHVGLVPIVMISPYDSCLINESGEERRKFMNSILSQLDKEYLRRLQNYNHLLMQRNRHLKSDSVNFDLLDAISDRLCHNAAYIYDKRREFSEQLLPVAYKYYKILSGGREEIDICYKSDIESSPLSELLDINREKDLALKYTTTGIQRDDLVFLMGGHPFRLSASQGQQKSFLIALKLAQFEIMRDIHKKLPVLLLDDVFDKLDIKRVEALLNMVSSDLFGQIFISDSNKVRVSEMLKNINGNSVLLELEEGRLK